MDLRDRIKQEVLRYHDAGYIDISDYSPAEFESLLDKLIDSYKPGNITRQLNEIFRVNIEKLIALDQEKLTYTQIFDHIYKTILEFNKQKLLNARGKNLKKITEQLTKRVLKIAFDPERYSVDVQKVEATILEAFQGGAAKDQYNFLFANQPQELAFQMSKSIMDSFNQHKALITQERIDDAIKRRSPLFQSGNAIISFNNLTIPGHTQNTKEEFEKQLYTGIDTFIKPKYKLFYWALWKYASEKGSPIFNGTKVNDIIKTMTGKNTVTYRERKEFTEFIYSCSMIQIRIYTGKTERKVRRSNKTYTEVEETFEQMPLLELRRGTEVYLKDQENRIVEGRALQRIYGKLPVDPNNIGAYIPNAAFKLNGNQSERIELVFELWKLANQRNFSYKAGDTYLPPNFNRKPLRYERLKWIELAGLTPTNQKNKTVANNNLQETFNKLKELNLISHYTPEVLPLEDDAYILVYLPDLRGQSNESEQVV